MTKYHGGSSACDHVLSLFSGQRRPRFIASSGPRHQPWVILAAHSVIGFIHSRRFDRPATPRYAEPIPPWYSKKRRSHSLEAHPYMVRLQKFDSSRLRVLTASHRRCAAIDRPRNCIARSEPRKFVSHLVSARHAAGQFVREP
jgi:hypothetical protein